MSIAVKIKDIFLCLRSDVIEYISVVKWNSFVTLIFVQAIYQCCVIEIQCGYAELGLILTELKIQFTRKNSLCKLLILLLYKAFYLESYKLL